MALGFICLDHVVCVIQPNTVSTAGHATHVGWRIRQGDIQSCFIRGAWFTLLACLSRYISFAKSKMYRIAIVCYYLQSVNYMPEWYIAYLIFTIYLLDSVTLRMRNIDSIQSRMVNNKIPDLIYWRTWRQMSMITYDRRMLALKTRHLFCYITSG